MDYSIIMDYIQPELLVLVPFLYILGMFAKEAACVPDNLIPALLGVAGVAVAVVWVLASTVPIGAAAVALAIVTALVQGILCAGVAVYCNQIIKQKQKATGEPTVTITQKELDSIAEAMGVSGKELTATLAAAKKNTSL